MKLLVIKASNRVVQNGQAITNWVNDHLQTFNQHFINTNQTLLEITHLNLGQLNLDLQDIEYLPRQGIYQSEDVIAWSELVSQHHALIFIVPEYNGTYPAVLKNALDHIANELVGKLCLIVGYAASSADLVVTQLNHTLFYMGAITVAKAQINLKDLGFEVKRGLAQDIYKLPTHADFNQRLDFALEQLFRFKDFIEQETPKTLSLDREPVASDQSNNNQANND